MINKKELIHVKCESSTKHPIIVTLVSIIAFLLVITYGLYILILATIYNLYMGKVGFKKFIRNLGLASDDIGGTIFYWTLRHTISANIGLREYNGDTTHKYIAKFVDFLFGENHCYCLAIREGLINVKH